MSKKKGDQVLQAEIETSEQWNELLSKSGLIVIEAYQNWCGPAKSFEPIFKKLKVDLSDPLLLFAIANADKISELENYRGRCEPCFLFFASRELVAVVRGANAPVIIKTITEQLAQEHKVLKGEVQRKVIVDSFMEQNKQSQTKKESKTVQNIMSSTLPITICIIKPDMMANNKKDEIKQKILEKGYKIEAESDITFTEKMAEQFYSHQKNSDDFPKLLTYMTSGPSCVLALSKSENSEDVINNWRDDIGSVDNPESFRAQYATDKLMNAIHGSDSHESAMKELAYFFPNGLGESNANNQRTLALIRPSALAEHKDAIINRIKENGFQIAMIKTVQFEKDDAESFYAEQKDQPFFDDLVKEMTSGPMLALCLVKNDAIASFRNILGPKEKEKIMESEGTLRKEFDIPNLAINSLHASSTPQQAQQELAKFFPIEQTVALLKPGLNDEQKAEIKQKIQDSGFIITKNKSERLTEEVAKEMYRYSSDKPYYQDLVNLMTSGETEVLVLSRENAIEGWREVIGDVDPNKAKETNGLRGLYGVDILNNGLHGATNKQQAEQIGRAHV